MFYSFDEIYALPKFLYIYIYIRRFVTIFFSSKIVFSYNLRHVWMFCYFTFVYRSLVRKKWVSGSILQKIKIKMIFLELSPTQAVNQAVSCKISHRTFSLVTGLPSFMFFFLLIRRCHQLEMRFITEIHAIMSKFFFLNHRFESSVESKPLQNLTFFKFMRCLRFLRVPKGF